MTADPPPGDDASFDAIFATRDASAPKRKRRAPQRKSLFDVDLNDPPPARPAKAKELSLFDDSPDASGGDDMFEFTKKPRRSEKKSIDLLGGDAPAAPRRERRGARPRPADLLAEAIAEAPAAPPAAPAEPAPSPAPRPADLGDFGYRDVRLRFATAADLRREAHRRLDQFEALIRGFDFSQTSGKVLSSPIPDDVLRESVHRLVADLHGKDVTLREQDILIDLLQEHVSSTFERDELAKEQKRKAVEVEEEKAQTAAQQAVVDEIRGRIKGLQKDLEDVRLGAEQSENEARQAHEQEIGRMVMEMCADQEPLEKRWRDAKNEKVQVEIQLMPMLDENARLKEGIDVVSFEGIEKLKAELPKRLAKVVREMRDGAGKMLETAFNPLREYSGAKVLTAVRNALQQQGRRALAA
jgi:hypothetical protein